MTIKELLESLPITEREMMAEFFTVGRRADLRLHPNRTGGASEAEGTVYVDEVIRPVIVVA